MVSCHKVKCCVFVLISLVIIKVVVLQRNKESLKDTRNTVGVDKYASKEEKEAIEIELRLEMRKAEWNRLSSKLELQIATSRTPNVIIIGARKCGTGPLNVFLGYHPTLVYNLESHYYDLHFQRGIDFYKSLLQNGSVDQLIVDKTPAYFTAPPANLPGIIKRDCPEVKIILVLCEPVQRSLSDYAQRFETPRARYKISFEKYMSTFLPPTEQMLRNKTRFENILKAMKRNHHLKTFTTGIYSLFLPRWTKAFPENRLLVLDGEKFLKNPGKVIESVQRFLSIPSLIKEEDFVRDRETGMPCLVAWWDDLFSASRRDDPQFHRCLPRADKGRTRSSNPNYKLNKKASDKLNKFYKPFNRQLKGMIKENWNWLN